ncbi:DUF305 domain-containing protein [Marisediminicola sp. LYQ134]|uniref:DUF305 domain-containing protein n=1 Tax=Marisediminicola sp. LYQ134 TaxID=3391061 RepID=UPI003983C730
MTDPTAPVAVDPGPADDTRPAASSGRGRRVLAAVIAGSLLLAGGLAIGRLTAGGAATPTTTSAEAGFARDMQTHHQQAVEMAMIIREESDDPAVLSLSYDIATSQAQQAGQMFGWLASWDLPQASPEPSMTWMTRPALDGDAHDHGADDAEHVPGEPMPGLATRDQIVELSEAEGDEADTLFLELMIAHHEGGIEMANAVLDRSTNPVVLPLARGIVFVQQGELDYMTELLERNPGDTAD